MNFSLIFENRVWLTVLMSFAVCVVWYLVLHVIVSVTSKRSFSRLTFKGQLTIHHYKLLRLLWRKEYDSIQPDVEKLCEEADVCENGVWQFGSCHTKWKIEQELMKERFGIFWPTPQDLEPNTEFD